jgi:hypothetical protein
LDQELLDVAAESPGYGGHFVEAGVVVVWTKDMSASAKNRAITALRNRGAISPNVAESSGVRFLPAKFDFVELSYWKALIPALAGEDLRLLDVDDIANRVTIGVGSASVTGRVRSALLNEGIPADAVEIVVVDNVVDDATLQDYTTAPRGGYLIKYNTTGGCTIGGNGYDPVAAKWYFLTAAHCGPTVGQVDAVSQHQPDTNYGAIGFEVRDEPWYDWTFQTSYPCPQSYNRCKIADVAMYEYSARSPDLAIARPLANSITLDSPDSWQQSGLWGGRMSVGTSIILVGAVSGKRTGSITHRCVDLWWTPQNGWYRCMDGANYVAQGGDSGAPILVASQSPNHGLFGFHKGRSSINGSSTIYSIYTPAINVRTAINDVIYYTWCASPPPGGSC